MARRRINPWWFGIIALPVFVIGVGLSLLPELTATAPATFGPPLRAGHRVFLLTGQWKQVFRFSSSRSRPPSDLLVDLWAFDAASLAPLYRQRVQTLRGGDMMGRTLLGAQGETLWLLLPAGPWAIDMATGRTLADPESLGRLNPELRGLLPTEATYYRFTPGGLTVQTADARTWYVHPQTFLAAAAPAAGLPPAIAPSHFTPQSAMAFVERGYPLGSHWLGVLTPDEALQFARDHTIGGLDDRSRRSLYAADITQEKTFFGGANRYGGFHPLTTDFLAPGLLAEFRPTGPGALVFRTDPASVFLLHRDRLGLEGRLQLARVTGPAGKVLWNTPLPLSILQAVLPGDSSLLLYGRRYLPRDPNDHGDPYHSARELLVAVDWKTGALHTWQQGEPVEEPGQ